MVLRFFAGLVIATVHGAAIAAAAALLGDKGPRYDRRLTLVPFGHIDVVGLASMMLSGYGWSKPVAIETAQLKLERWGLVIVVLTGSLVLLALAWLITLLVIPVLTLLPYTAGIAITAFVRVAARLCIWAALLALVPLPPLAGAHLLTAIGIRLPASAGLVLGWVLLFASALGIARLVLTPLYTIVAPLILGAELAAG